MGVRNRFLPAGAGRKNIESFTRSEWAIDGVIVTATAEQLNNSTGGLIYKGAWNANTNTPTLTSSVGTQGDFYIVDVAGSTTLNGISSWVVGDWAIFNGTAWEKISSNEGALLIAQALGELFAAGKVNNANINLGGLAPSANITISPNTSYISSVPFPKVVRMTFGDLDSKFVLPPSNQQGSPSKNNAGVSFLINEGLVDGNVYTYGTDGSDGTLVSSINALSGLIVWNADNSDADGDWHAYDYVIPAQISRTSIVQTTNDTVTTLLAVPVAEGSQVTLSGVYSAAENDYTAGVGQGGNFVATVSREVSGDVILLGTPIINAVNNNPPTLTIDVDIGTQSLRLRVTGEVATTYNWSTTYTKAIN